VKPEAGSAEAQKPEAGRCAEAGSHVQWLTSRCFDAPPALTACVRDLLDAHPEWASLPRTDAFVEASEVLLRRVLEGGAAARANALDLLAADACVTWAFEVAADDPGTIADRAERATRRIAAIAAEFTVS
jgi:hypothetical protein